MKKYIMIFLVVLVACGPDDYRPNSPTVKACLDQKIQNFDKQSICDMSGDVKEYAFQGKQVYVFNPGDCGADFTSEVIDNQCNVLGYLGGITGNEKINGVSFLAVAVYVQTIWKKNRYDYTDEMEMEAQKIAYEYDQIKSIASSTSCTDASQWTFYAIGSKACGGPEGYIAFPKNIASTLIPRIDAYTQSRKDFDQRWNAYSNCSFALAPSKVDCVNGKAELVY